MKLNVVFPVVGVLTGIGVTAALCRFGLDGLGPFALFPLLLVFWLLQRFKAAEIGFRWGQGCHYFLAVIYPVALLGLAALIAVAFKATDLTHTNWRATIIYVGWLTPVTTLLVVITEEGFFRGWLWASIQQAGQSQAKTIVWTSLAFALWHLPVVIHEPRMPIYLLGACTAGLVWGMLRQVSGSIIVTSLSHGLWNGLAYPLFGTTDAGALGIKNAAVFGPEKGLLGLVLNIMLMAAFWWWLNRDSPQSGNSFAPNS